MFFLGANVNFLLSSQGAVGGAYKVLIAFCTKCNWF